MADKKCLECDKAFRPRSNHAAFCGTPCRRRWNNRRMLRGAELYDLFMLRATAKSDDVKARTQRMMDALAEDHRSADERERAGRRSWALLRDVIYRNPVLTRLQD